jgi:hypothetical protein
VLADALAFRRRSLFGALLPGLFVFGVSALYGDDRHRVASVVALAIAAILFAVAHRIAFFDRGNGWVEPRSSTHHRHVMSSLAVAACAVLVALAVGPSLPGARNDAIVAWRDIGNGWASGDDGVTLAPLVSVRAQLVEQSDRVAFSVEATQADYWRVTALDSFDGVTWSAGSSNGVLVLPTAPVPGALRQVVTIAALRGRMLPAALAASAVATDDDTVTFDPSTATVRTQDGLADGDTFIVWSDTTDGTAPSNASRALPRGVRQQLAPLVSDIVADAGAVSAIDRARALEAWFHGNFVYDLDVAAGSSVTDIASFLDTRRGYCEQFAATFAAMARVLGIPSRVAVGYRVGTFDEASGAFSVTGRDAHAWAEVYLSGRGWVRFDPTSAGSVGGDTDAAAATTPTSETAPTSAPATEAPTTTVGAAETTMGEAAEVPFEDAVAGSRDRPDVVPIALVVISFAALSALPTAIDLTRRHRRRRAASADRRAQIVWWWNDALRWFRIAGADLRPSETPIEAASRAGPAIALAAPKVAVLAQLVTEACYAADGPSPADLDVARASAVAIRRDAKEQMGPTWRLRAYVDQLRGVVAHTGSTSSSVAHASSVS